MSQTKQKTIIKQPRSGDCNIGLTIACPKCQTHRVFKIDDNLEEFKSRRIAGFGVQTYCEKCGYEISVNIVWINATVKGYSYRRPAYYDTDCISVGDENGLSPNLSDPIE